MSLLVNGKLPQAVGHAMYPLPNAPGSFARQNLGLQDVGASMFF